MLLVSHPRRVTSLRPRVCGTPIFICVSAKYLLDSKSTTVNEIDIQTHTHPPTLTDNSQARPHFSNQRTTATVRCTPPFTRQANLHLDRLRKFIKERYDTARLLFRERRVALDGQRLSDGR